MIHHISISDLDCILVKCEAETSKVVYIIYPETDNHFPETWLTELAAKYQIHIVLIYIPYERWSDMLTPCQISDERTGSNLFGDKACSTLIVLQQEIIPQCEYALGMSGEPERTLIGVSLSGLFALWQWMVCDTFCSIGCISGSFWYDGFVEWLGKQPIPHKTGKAYFLLGKQEQKTRNRMYHSIGVNTETIYRLIEEAGIHTQLDLVPGGHHSNPLPRIEAALNFIYEHTQLA